MILMMLAMAATGRGQTVARGGVMAATGTAGVNTLPGEGVVVVVAAVEAMAGGGGVERGGVSPPRLVSKGRHRHEKGEKEIPESAELLSEMMSAAEVGG